MLRRHTKSDEPRYSHESTPRKRRSFLGANSQEGNILRHRSSYRPENEWINKRFIPLGQFPRVGETEYVSEREIMRISGQYMYRIIFANQDGSYKSKPAIEYRPHQLNIVLDPNTERIIDVAYF